MVSFGSEWIYLDFRMAFLKKFSKNILPDDTPIRALEMWRNFVAKHGVHIEPELALERKTHREGISNRGAAAPQVCPRPRPGIDPMW